MDEDRQEEARRRFERATAELAAEGRFGGPEARISEAELMAEATELSKAGRDTVRAMALVRQLLAQGVLSIEELVDLAHEELDRIEAGDKSPDTTTWIAILDFADRIHARERKADVDAALAILDRAPDVEPDPGDEIVNSRDDPGTPR